MESSGSCGDFSIWQSRFVAVEALTEIVGVGVHPTLLVQEAGPTRAAQYTRIFPTRHTPSISIRYVGRPSINRKQFRRFLAVPLLVPEYGRADFASTANNNDLFV
jgi:hypothetical protein